MRLAVRLLASVLLLTISLPAGVAQADGSDSLVISGLSSNETAGVQDSFTVDILSGGIDDTAYTGTVHFDSSDNAVVLPSDYTFTLGDAGHQTFNVTFKTAGSQSLTATDVDFSVTTDSASTTVAAASPATVTLTGGTSDLASGASRTVTATVTDAFTNPVPGQTVTFSQSSGAGSVDGLGGFPTNASGQATDDLTGDVAGPVVVMAATGGHNDTLPFNVVPGPLDHIILTPNSSTISPGGSQPYTTKSYDAQANQIADVTGTATLGITPDGTCGSTSCSATVHGAHTVTSTYLGKTDTSTLTVGNNPPVANTDAKTILENASSTAIDVLANDTDADNDPLTVTSVGNPPHGTATVDGGGTGIHYTPDTNYFGSDTFSYSIDDGHGGTDSGTVNVTILLVNHAPSFAKGANDSTLEDSGAQTTSGWATAISPGPASESGQSVSFTESNDNTSLFLVQPAVSPSGDLTYTPAANANGTANVSVTLHDNGGTANGGVDTSAPQTFTITVTAVNDAPTWTKGPDETVLENSGAKTVPGWASAFSPGPANESTQVLSITTTNDNNSLFSSQPVVTLAGTLAFTPATNANGSATVSVKVSDDGGTTNGGVDHTTKTFVINVTSVNQVPTFTGGGNDTTNEDSGARTVSGWATNMDAGAPNESGQNLNFIVTNTNNPLFSVQPAVDATSGDLTYTPAANANGSATVTVKLHDDGGTLGGGVDTSPGQTMTITVNAVNDAPTFPDPADQVTNEDSGAQIVVGLAAPTSAGPANESSQVLTFNLTNDNNALFTVGGQPALDPITGTLTYTPAPNANGSANVTAILSDNGGTAFGGVNHLTHMFTITVSSVNDAPTFTKGADVTLPEETSPSGHSVTNWATGFNPGPADEAGQTNAGYTVTNDHPLLFSVQPAISVGGTLTFTLEANRNGVANVSVTVRDSGGTARGGVDTSAIQTFTITVTGVDHPPAAIPDFPTVVQGSGPVRINVLANDTDPDGDTLTVAGIRQGTSGKVAITSDHKAVTYDPNGSFIGTDAFIYSVTDGRGQVSFATVDVTVVKDTIGPVTSVPTAWLMALPVTSWATIALTWSGTDQGFGVSYYQVQESRNNTPWVWLTVPKGAAFIHRGIAVGNTYQYRVRGVDKAGNAGAWSYLPNFSSTLSQESAATYIGTWTGAALAGASGGHVSYASTHGSVASFTCTCSSLMWIGPKSATRSTARVYIDGVLIGIYTEKNATTLASQGIFAKTWGVVGTHRIDISVTGGGRVDVDAFLALH